MEQQKRLAIVNQENCKPKKCGLECKKICPINKSGKLCIDASKTMAKAIISEQLCIGCNLCVKKCPLKAIKIINLPSNLGKDISHCYGENSFQLHRLPVPKMGQVLGLVGTNGIGKSTALKILSTDLMPNLGNYTEPPTWEDIITRYRGSELQNYFKKVREENLKTITKPQYIYQLKQSFEKQTLKQVSSSIQAPQELVESLLKELSLDYLLERQVD